MVAVVSHDAGGAELVSSWLRQIREPFALVLDGPARRIFAQKLGEFPLSPLEEALDKADWLLAGTSWASDLEKNAILLARRRGIRAVAYLDHWVNYRRRFFQGQLPDELWVTDEFALRLAHAELPELPAKVMGNPYLDEIVEGIRAISAKGTSRPVAPAQVLYICEPIADHARKDFGNLGHWGYNEHKALRFFLQNLKLLGLENPQVRVRPHPSENREKYQWAEHEFAPRVNVTKEKNLVEDIAGAQVVVGCESMALVVALEAGRRVVCAIPPGGHPCRLPHLGIEKLGYPEKAAP